MMYMSVKKILDQVWKTAGLFTAVPTRTRKVQYVQERETEWRESQLFFSRLPSSAHLKCKFFGQRAEK